ncbi:MAG: CDP-2,3-bis-(O-geranylgeranyl)-sn-glycerol synthase [Candidatus Thorarchaeota archaeon]|nr:MAG: CDP-2,3-bis-(O-geranylgeranyl)-sn-glycerol synthase [Candidatus Thorarchaeota archaeon]
MYEEVALIGLALWIGLPAWITNSTPVIFGGGRPIDGGRFLRDGHRILGDGKTIRGFIAGVVCGTLTALAQYLAAPFVRIEMENYIVVTPEMDVILFMGVLAGFMLSLGTLVGDLVGSFVKRRANLKSGAPSPVLDQLGFIIMALIFAAPFFAPSPSYPAVAVLFVMTFLVHYISNVGGYLLGVKEHPW